MRIARTTVVRRTVLIAFMGLSVLVPLAAQSQGPDDGLSGLAVNALVAAYKHFGLGAEGDAPFRLESYVVVIRQYGDGFSVGMGNHRTGDRHLVYIGSDGSVVAKPNPDLAYRGVTLLPGIIAGEIIATYHYAVSDPDELPTNRERLRRGAYNLEYDPYPASLEVGFTSANPPFAEVRIGREPTATPSPGMTCLAGACFGQIAAFTVKIVNGKLINKRRGIV